MHNKCVFVPFKSLFYMKYAPIFFYIGVVAVAQLIRMYTLHAIYFATNNLMRRAQTWIREKETKSER